MTMPLEARDAMHRNEGFLPVPGARLFHRITGSGPLLLILQGGDGDADGTRAMVEHLAAHYTVVTYDPRGLSRSVLETPPAEPWLETHVDDAHRLLASLGRGPALVFGTSRGAFLGLELVARHPEQVLALVAHEPPAPQLLPEEARARAREAQAGVEAAFSSEGVVPAMRRFAAFAGLDFVEREPGVELPPPGPGRMANLAFFLKHDAPAIHRYSLDLERALGSGTPIVPAVGARSRGHMAHHCAGALAARLGVEAVEFPGAHGGFVTHPAGFAAKLHATLSQFTARGETRGA